MKGSTNSIGDLTLAAFLVFAISVVLLALAEHYDINSKRNLEEINRLTREISERDNKVDMLRRKLYTVQREMAYLRQEIDRLNVVAFGPQVQEKTSGYAVVTAYTAYHESTGKNPGDKGFNITRSGVPGGYGVCAADPRYWKFGTILYVEGLGVCVILDTGGAIRGKWRFDYMFGGQRESAVRLALQWGRRLTRVVVIGN